MNVTFSVINTSELISILTSEDRTFESSRSLIMNAISNNELVLNSRYQIEPGSLSIDDFIRIHVDASSSEIKSHWQERANFIASVQKVLGIS